MTPNHSRISRLPVRQLSVVLLSALALSSCASAPSEESNAAQNSDKLQVMTTFVPITNFTKAVAGDRAQVTQLLPNNVGPHDYQAKPTDVQKLASADVVVKNGLEIETFLEDMVSNAENNELAVIDSSEGIEVIPYEEEHGEHEGEEHGGHAGHEGEEHAEGKEHAEHDHGENDPHIWLDPKKAIQQVENIRDGLMAADPDGQSTYEANAAAYIEQLKELDSEFTQQLQPFAGKTFVTYHDFASYFARSYNLKVEYLVDVPQANASPEDANRVLEAAKASSLKTLLSEPLVTDSPFKALANDLNIQVGIFDPMGAGGAEALEADYYITTMRKNLENLTTAFGGQPQAWVPAQPRQRTRTTLSQWIRI